MHKVSSVFFFKKKRRLAIFGIIEYRYVFVPSVSEYCKMLLFLQKEYKKDLESEIKGKGMLVGTDTLGIQHAKRASEIASEVSIESE